MATSDEQQMVFDDMVERASRALSVDNDQASPGARLPLQAEHWDYIARLALSAALHWQEPLQEER